MSEKPVDPSAQGLRQEAERLARLESASHEELRIHQIELKLQQEELQRSVAYLEIANRRFRALFEEAPIALVELDGGGRVLQANLRARELLPIQIDGYFVNLATHEDRGAVRSLLNATERPPRLEVVLDGIEGPATVRLSFAPLPETRIVSIEDVTEERKAQAAVKQSEAQLRALWEASPDAVAVVQRGRVVFGNPSLSRLVGVVHEQLTSFDLFEHLSETLGGRPEGGPAELKLRSKDGVIHTVERRTVPIEYGGEQAEFWSMRDLTERRRLESNLSRSERLASIGVLVAGVAHEINNPLAFVLANLQSVHDQLRARGNEGELLEEVSDALEGAVRMASIVSDLRTFRQSEDSIELTRPNEVIARTLRLAEGKIAHQAELRRDLGKIPEVMANEGRLAQILLNLILNAVEAMPKERARDQNWVRVRSYATAEHVCIAVEDNGLGISIEAKKRVFDPFYTTRKGEGGSGLGLAISESFVQQLGGFIAVESTVGVGSNFLVHLPLESSSPKQRPGPAPKRVPVSGRMLRLLVVDDEPAVARALSRITSSYASTKICTSAFEASEVLEQDAAFDAIVCDLVMPGGGGEQLLAWLDANQPGLVSRLIFMSGMPHPQSDQEQRVPRIQKPFDLELIRAMLYEVAPG